MALLRDSIAATVAKTWLHQEHVLSIEYGEPPL